MMISIVKIISILSILNLFTQPTAASNKVLREVQQNSAVFGSDATKIFLHLEALIESLKASPQDEDILTDVNYFIDRKTSAGAYFRVLQTEKFKDFFLNSPVAKKIHSLLSLTSSLGRDFTYVNNLIATSGADSTITAMTCIEEINAWRKRYNVDVGGRDALMDEIQSYCQSMENEWGADNLQFVLEMALSYFAQELNERFPSRNDLVFSDDEKAIFSILNFQSPFNSHERTNIFSELQRVLGINTKKHVIERANGSVSWHVTENLALAPAIKSLIATIDKKNYWGASVLKYMTADEIEQLLKSVAMSWNHLNDPKFSADLLEQKVITSFIGSYERKVIKLTIPATLLLFRGTDHVPENYKYSSFVELVGVFQEFGPLIYDDLANNTDSSLNSFDDALIFEPFKEISLRAALIEDWYFSGHSKKSLSEFFSANHEDIERAVNKRAAMLKRKPNNPGRNKAKSRTPKAKGAAPKNSETKKSASTKSRAPIPLASSAKQKLEKGQSEVLEKVVVAKQPNAPKKPTKSKKKRGGRNNRITRKPQATGDLQAYEVLVPQEEVFYPRNPSKSPEPAPLNQSWADVDDAAVENEKSSELTGQKTIIKVTKAKPMEQASQAQKKNSKLRKIVSGVKSLGGKFKRSDKEDRGHARAEYHEDASDEENEELSLITYDALRHIVAGHMRAHFELEDAIHNVEMTKNLRLHNNDFGMGYFRQGAKLNFVSAIQRVLMGMAHCRGFVPLRELQQFLQTSGLRDRYLRNALTNSLKQGWAQQHNKAYEDVVEDGSNES